jgi:hypothetical protein
MVKRVTSTAPALTKQSSRTGQPGPKGDGDCPPPILSRLWWTRRPALLDTLVCLAYVVLAAWLTHGLWPDPDTRTLALNPEDQILYEWFLAHDTLLWSGDFSLVSDRLNAPDGVNLLANTTVIALGGLMAPVTLAFGAATTFALILGMNLAGTAIAWFLLFRRTMNAGRAAAAVGAAFCGFAPGIISQSNSHLHMTAQWLIPPMLWCVIELARTAKRQPVPARRMITVGAAFGGLVAVQVFIGEETLFLTALTLILVTLAYVVLTRPRLAHLGRFSAGLVVGTGVAVVLLAYPLWTQFKGPQSVPNGVFSPHYFSADLAGFVAISPLSVAGDEAAATLSTGAAEYNTFLGWPLVLVALGLAIWLRRQAVALSCAAAALIMSALALGPEVVINGERTHIDGPFTLMEGLPVVDGALPMRFALAAIPLIAVLIVLAMDRARRSTYKFVRMIVPALVAAALLPLAPLPLPTTDRPAVPKFYADGHWRECVSDGEVLIPVPLPNPPQPGPMRFATAANTAFALPEGFFIGPYGRNGTATMGTAKRPTSQLFADVAKTGVVPDVDDAQRAQAKTDLQRWRAKCVVLTAHPHSEQLLLTLEALLGPGTPVADAVIWRQNW